MSFLTASTTFKSIPPPENPTYTSDDLTVLIPTICREDQHDDFRLCLRSCLAIKPHEIRVSTIESDLLRITELAYSIDPRIQIYEAILRITTPITILADDNIKLPLESLPHILTLFKDSKIGVVGTCQRVRRRPGLEIIDQIWILCYVTETWLGIPLNADDDNFVTRLLVAKGWGIRIQMCKEAEQCLRWARSNLRSNTKSIIFEWRVWMQTPWSLYVLLLATLSHSLITDPLLAFLLHCSTSTWDPSHRLLSFCIFALWLLFTKVVKLVPHFVLYPIDICFIPVTIFFGYFHSLIKFYALLTLHLVSLRTLPFLILY
ncbi:putative polysaccharide synthase Cps1 [Amylocarpus encephaloides]|uniref:Polysaccharide synthase Cps1 n=1 Tax=Amylocarpus encephaloides TaxID=45428 RepID=A0A9P7YEG1_9HELO|nr:putative polysaccharide synthase Cps1 [Amylocarpus encephaloides]